MGHLGHLKQEYHELLTRLEAGQVALPQPEDPVAREGWRQVLELMYTPEEAKLASRLPVRPSRLGSLARRLEVDEVELKRRLDTMCDKGIVMDLVHPSTGETRYALSPPVVGFFEFSFMRAHDMYPKKPLAKALDAYMHNDPAFAREVFGYATNPGRALVNEEHLAAGPRPDVLPWQRATDLLASSRSLAVSLCYCRHKAEHLGKGCDAPQEICLSLNAGADFVTRRGFGRAIEHAEALELLQEGRTKGLVQIADNVQRHPVFMCNCCGCCCGQLRGITEFGLQAVNPSGFTPSVDADRCKGCSRCARACPVAAITMTAERRTSQQKNALLPRVDLERCIGCGVCAGACKKKAMEMVEAPAGVPNVPTGTLERTLRMTLERGRLGRLLVDEGTSRGPQFLHRALQALVRLPAVERALAAEQLQSRFVRFVLSTVDDPTEARR